jgi:hypothetical protein
VFWVVAGVEAIKNGNNNQQHLDVIVVSYLEQIKIDKINN